MFRNIAKKETKAEIIQSYLGLLKHGTTHKLQQQIQKKEDFVYWFFWYTVPTMGKNDIIFIATFSFIIGVGVGFYLQTIF